MAKISGNTPEGQELPDRPGEWQIRTTENGLHLAFACPNGHGCCGVLPIENQAHAWQFDGNMEAPTLAPSIKCLNRDCNFHGFMRAGIMVPC